MENQSGIVIERVKEDQAGDQTHDHFDQKFVSPLDSESLLIHNLSIVIKKPKNPKPQRVSKTIQVY